MWSTRSDVCSPVHLAALNCFALQFNLVDSKSVLVGADRQKTSSDCRKNNSSKSSNGGHNSNSSKSSSCSSSTSWSHMISTRVSKRNLQVVHSRTIIPLTYIPASRQPWHSSHHRPITSFGLSLPLPLSHSLP